ncbi:hypothetical protein ACFZAC_26160 [Pseudomonas fluorescens]|uniref:hypothetical protein n=1 Tax=Pseudomonas fluorescens TaxID=294 RepID=UPI0037498080
MQLLKDLIEAALAHQGAHVRHDGNGDVTQYIPVPPAATRTFKLGEGLPVQAGVRTVSAKELTQRGVVGRLATLPANDNQVVGRRDFMPSGTAVGKQTDLSASLLENSLVAQAGARIIVIPDAPTLTSGDVVMVQRPAAFVVVEAGQLVAVDDGDDLVASALPLKRIDLGTDLPAVGVRFDLTRRQLKDLSNAVTTDAIWTAIGLSMANEADRVLLAALNAHALANFGLPAVAARGLRFDELRAIAGTSATGAAIGVDGILRANGVRAELTNQAAGTVIGAFSRSAVAVQEDIRVTALRTLNGGVQITVFANMEALVPDFSAFWKAA